MNGWWNGALESKPNAFGLIAGNYIQKTDLPVMKKGGSIAKSQAEFWKNMEKEGKLPVIKPTNQPARQAEPVHSEDPKQPLLPKQNKKSASGGCCVVL
jgi:hypothetical protein